MWNRDRKFLKGKIQLFVLLHWVLALERAAVLGARRNIPTLGSSDNPRILIRGLNIRNIFDNHVQRQQSVFLYDGDSPWIYVGRTDAVLKLDSEDFQVIEEFPLNSVGLQACKEGECRNVVTVIEKLQDSLFVCATNGQKPQCWKFSSINNQSVVEHYGGVGISPFLHTQNSISLSVEGDLYSAASLDEDGNFLQFRRKVGSRNSVWMHENWLTEPTFISASWVKRMEDPDNDKIYMFFREKNLDPSPEADRWISRVARVCKVDEGGSKRFFQNMWTSFLKARLVCGFPEESLYFNRLQDVYVVHADNWRHTRIYALFTSSWNSTAVCIYSIDGIEDVFENSTFKGYNNNIPKPRPGMCATKSGALPLTTLTVIREHSEMTDWIHSIHYAAPFYISNNNYTKIVVDQVQAVDQQIYNVLYLSTDSGKIRKVLEAETKPFIISETWLSIPSTIQSMKLDCKKKKLVFGFSEKISMVDLQRCQDYNDSCESCVLARDPYCAWSTLGCVPTVPEGIQNIMNGDISVCNISVKEQNAANRSKRETDSQTPMDLDIVHLVPLGVPFYLSCPIISYHADYTWRHGNRRSPCLQMQSSCLHLIPVMTEESYGKYECVSEEKGYAKVVKHYQLFKQQIPDCGMASAVATQLWLSFWMAVAVTAAAHA